MTSALKATAATSSLDVLSPNDTRCHNFKTIHAIRDAGLLGGCQRWQLYATLALSWNNRRLRLSQGVGHLLVQIQVRF